LKTVIVVVEMFHPFSTPARTSNNVRERTQFQNVIRFGFRWSNFWSKLVGLRKRYENYTVSEWREYSIRARRHVIRTSRHRTQRDTYDEWTTKYVYDFIVSRALRSPGPGLLYYDDTIKYSLTTTVSITENKIALRSDDGKSNRSDCFTVLRFSVSRVAGKRIWGRSLYVRHG